MADSKANLNITFLVFRVSILCIVGTKPYQIFFIIGNIIDEERSILYLTHFVPNREAPNMTP